MNDVYQTPDAWTIKSLDEIANKITDGAHFSPVPQEHGELIANVKDMAEAHIDFEACTKITHKAFDELKKQNCSPSLGDILLSKDGTIGKVILYSDNKEIVVLSSIAIIRLDESVSSDFVKHVLRSFIFDKQLYSLQSGSALKRIVLADIRKLSIPLPTRMAQEKIAKILTTIDQLIEKTQALINKHTAIKQGMMDDLFTRGIDLTTGQLRPAFEQSPHLYKETELGWIPKDWQFTTLNQLIARLDSGISVNSDETSDFISEKQILKTSCLSGCVFNPSEAKQIIEKDLGLVDLSVKANTILISRMNTPSLVGENAYISKNYPTLFVPDRIWQTVRNETIQYSVKWLGYVLSSKKMRERISGLATGTSGSMKNISKPSFLSLELGLPSFDEQLKKLNILDKEESFIDHNQQLLQKYKSTKSGLMQDFLTGKVSVDN